MLRCELSNLLAHLSGSPAVEPVATRVVVPTAQGIELLTRLRVLDVSNNRLSSLPSLGTLTQLQVRLPINDFWGMHPRRAGKMLPLRVAGHLITWLGCPASYRYDPMYSIKSAPASAPAN